MSETECEKRAAGRLQAIVHPIPEMTDELGKYWQQPSRFAIEVDGANALMLRETWHQLAEYSASIPIGVYAGKMWRAEQGDALFLCWYSETDRPGVFHVNSRRAILV